jgi:hypothetical protein
MKILSGKIFGGSRAEFGSSVQELADHGFIVAGGVWSDDGDVSGNHGYWDCWVLRLDFSWKSTVAKMFWRLP